MRKIISASLCYVGTDKETLMLYRNKKESDIHKGKWNGLGGKVEFGETPRECAIREVFEESGLQVKTLEFAGFIVFPLFDGKNDWHVHLYRIPEFEGHLIDSSEGELKWIANNEVLDLTLWEGDRIFLKWFFDRKMFEAKFIYRDNKLIKYDVFFFN